MNKRKVAFFTVSMRRGGAERVVANLCNYLCDKYEVHLLLFENVIDYRLDQRIQVSFIADGKDIGSEIKKLMVMPFYAKKLKAWLKRHQVDIFFSFLFRPNVIAVLAKKTSSKLAKIVISERSNPWLQYKGKGIKGLVNRFLIRNVYPGADFITVNSFGSKYALQHHYHVKEEKIGIIRNPISAAFHGNRERDTSSRFIYVSVGRMDEGKNHVMLIRAFAAMLAADPGKQAELWLIGEGPLKDYLEQEAKRLEIAPFVQFLGYRGDVAQILQQSDVFVFSSQREGFPNVLLEAMAVGLPVISTDCEYGPREIITDEEVLPDGNLDKVEVGKYGILLPCNHVAHLAEAMNMVYKNEELRRKLTQDYAQLLSGYRIEAIARQYEQMITAVQGDE